MAEKILSEVIGDTDMGLPKQLSVRTMCRLLNDIGFAFQKRKRNSTAGMGGHHHVAVEISADHSRNAKGGTYSYCFDLLDRDIKLTMSIKTQMPHVKIQS